MFESSVFPGKCRTAFDLPPTSGPSILLVLPRGSGEAIRV
jgi:hypothetical protein